MKQTTFSILGIGIIALLVILSVALPVSGAGKTGPQDGTGNQFGSGAAYQNGSDQMGGFGNGTCLCENCPYNGTPPQDGTGMQYGQSGNGYGSDGQGYGPKFRI